MKGVYLHKTPMLDWLREVRDTDECVLFQGALYPNGYGRVRVDGKSKGAHRISYIFHKGSIPPGLQVNHLCRSRACVNPRHLYAGTPSQNMLDKNRDGTMLKGENHPLRKHPEVLPHGDQHWSRKHPERLHRGDDNPSRRLIERMSRGETHYLRRNPEKACMGEKNAMSKLTESAVKAMRMRYPLETCASLSRCFGVSSATVSRVVHRKTWRHL